MKTILNLLDLIPNGEGGLHVLHIDKKEIIWKNVSKKEPQITWHYTKNNTLKKECFDMADSYTCVLGYMIEQKIW